MLLAWIKHFRHDRRLKKQMVLSYQNVQTGFFLENLCEPHSRSQQLLETMNTRFWEILQTVRPGELLSRKDADYMLEVNFILRRIHDEKIPQPRQDFDSRFMPPEGWDAFFERMLASE